MSPETLEKLKQRMSKFPNFTYNAMNKAGDLHTNTNGSKPNAVTWGVFPGREVVQPTIVELSSFDAWKDEAFALWEQWSRCYPQQSKPRELLNELGQTWYLVNIVNNDYHEKEGIFEIFKEDVIAVQQQQQADAQAEAAVAAKLQDLAISASGDVAPQVQAMAVAEAVKA